MDKIRNLLTQIAIWLKIQKNRSNILDLNDDCLIKVLSFLEFEDIFNLHKAHQRFNAAIAANLKDVVIQIRDDNCQRMESFLRKFGGKMKRIQLFMEAECNSRQIEALITKYCNKGNIEHCSVIQFHINVPFFENNSNLFRSLRSLKLSQIDLDNDLFHRILDTAAHMADLDLEFFAFANGMSHFLMKLSSCRHLRSLRFYCSRILNDDKVECAPRLNSLQTLCMYLFTEQTWILAHFPNVKNLTLSISWPGHYSLIPLTELTSLKRLDLQMGQVTDADLYSLLQHLAVRNTLEHLTLGVRTVYNGRRTEVDYKNDFAIVDILSRCTRLESLVLQTPWEFKFRILNLVQPLTRLRCLNVDGQELQSLDLMEIQRWVCEMVSSATKLNRIQLKIHHKPRIADETHHQFYEKVSLTRSNQANNTLLKVQVDDHSRRTGDNSYIQTNKWVILDIVGGGKC